MVDSEKDFVASVELPHEDFRCGMVSIVGRPNVGKSTLLNKIVGEKVAIVSRIPQTTRNQIRGIYNDERGQIVFIDTPGLHLGKDKLDEWMNRLAYETTHSADCIIHLIDSKSAPGEEEEGIVKRLAGMNAPIILGLNKVDRGDKYIPDYIALWEKIKGKPIPEMKNFTLLPLSAKEGTHVEKLLNILFDYLPKGPALYPRDSVTDTPQKIVIADIIREKLFAIMRDEIPHSIAVIVEDMQPKKKKILHIRALILVERDSQKEIVIGKGGLVLKQVGTQARGELEELLSKKIFLELYVKSKRNWRDNNALLEEMGYGV